MDTNSDASAATEAKPTLLIVDDEEGPRQSLKIVFKADYNVLVASNPAAAVALAHEQTIDVAVLDILMEGMSGVDLLRELKTIDPHIEVVMLTAYETVETARQALRHGASDYLNKPFDIATMRAAVSCAAKKRRIAIEMAGRQTQLHSLQLEIENQREQQEMARAKGEIYASVLHDINSPLTIISGFVELINHSMETAASVEGQQLETIKGDLKQLHGQVGRCFEISRRYLSFLNSNEAEMVTVGLRQILVDLKDLLQRHPSARGHELVIGHLVEDTAAEINGTDLLQVLLNLTINALQSADEPHRVEVSASLLTQPLALDTFTDGPSERLINREGFLNRAPLLAIAISDNGPGIPPGIVARMFEQPFTTKAPDRGTGLGLSIVKRLIRGAHGAVHLQTAPGGGSTFTVFVQARE